MSEEMPQVVRAGVRVRRGHLRQQVSPRQGAPDDLVFSPFSKTQRVVDDIVKSNYSYRVEFSSVKLR
jgi:hypothetical protein